MRAAHTATATGSTYEHVISFAAFPFDITIARVKQADFFLIVIVLLAPGSSEAQSPSGRNPDVSNKALITKSTPSINEHAFKSEGADATPAALHKMADDYYAWRTENYPD